MRKASTVLAMGLVALFSSYSTLYAQDIPELVSKKATEYKIPVAFAQALIRTESNYKPQARGARGEYGLGQINCNTAKRIGFQGSCDRLSDPSTNLDYSFKYLRMALDKSKDDLCGAATLYSTSIERIPGKSAYCRLVLKRMI
jgi:soluble lytic murein transglycosylase-like protein